MTRCVVRPSLVGVLLLLAACRPDAPAPPDLSEKRETRALLAQFRQSSEAWNRGDFDGFLGMYAQDSATGFVSGGHVNHGAIWIRKHYQPDFAPGAPRDSLRFEEFEVRPLAPTVALVTARYILYRNGQTTSSGPFTLVMERRTDGWKILHDHTSTD